MSETIDMKDNLVAAPGLRTKPKEELEHLMEVVDASAQALQAGYRCLFISEVSDLLSTYKLSLNDVRRMLDGEPMRSMELPRKGDAHSLNPNHPQTVSRDDLVSPKSRPEKTYLNPHTGERISLKSSKNKIFKLWQVQYGVETVHGWLVSQ